MYFYEQEDWEDLAPRRVLVTQQGSSLKSRRPAWHRRLAKTNPRSALCGLTTSQGFNDALIMVSVGVGGGGRSLLDWPGADLMKQPSPTSIWSLGWSSLRCTASLDSRRCPSLMDFMTLLSHTHDLECAGGIESTRVPRRFRPLEGGCSGAVLLGLGRELGIVWNINQESKGAACRVAHLDVAWTLQNQSRGL